MPENQPRDEPGRNDRITSLPPALIVDVAAAAEAGHGGGAGTPSAAGRPTGGIPAADAPGGPRAPSTAGPWTVHRSAGAGGGEGGGTPRRRGRPRSAEADEAIIGAVLDLLAEEGSMTALSMEAVAARAGVGKATIYRRWSSKEDLVVAAMATLHRPLPEIAGVSVRDDLMALLEPLRQRNLDERARRILPPMLGDAARRPDLFRRYKAAVIDHRREAVHQVLRRGIRTGEVRPDTDIELVGGVLSGALLFRTLVTHAGEVPEPRVLAQLVDTVLFGIAPRTGRPPAGVPTGGGADAGATPGPRATEPAVGVPGPGHAPGPGGTPASGS